MEIPFNTWTYLAGDTPEPLGFLLDSVDVRSGAVIKRPLAGDVVECTVSWPGGDVTKTSAQDGGLSVDPRSGVVRFPIDVADLAPLQVGVPYRVVVRLVDADDRRRTWLYGAIVKQGAPT